MGLKSFELDKLVAEYGAINLRFFIQMQPSESLAMFGMPLGMKNSDSPWMTVECEIDEHRYKVSEGYKITLKPVNQELYDNRWYFANETYYQSDFESMAHRRPDDYKIYVLVDEDDKYKRLH